MSADQSSQNAESKEGRSATVRVFRTDKRLLKIRAAERDTSVPRLVHELLEHAEERGWPPPKGGA